MRAAAQRVLVDLNQSGVKRETLQTLDPTRGHAKLTFDKVLLVGNGDKISVGQPSIKGASVAIEIVEHLRGPKLRIFKFKRRRAYRRRMGHRDALTRIRVTAISA